MTRERIISRRTGITLGAAVLASLVGGIVGSALIDPAEPPAAAAPAVPVAGSASTEGSAGDPRGGLPFGVKVWRTDSGQTCAVLGNRKGEEITDPTGQQVYRPGPDEGSCVGERPTDEDLDVRRDTENYVGGRREMNQATIIWGTAKAGITRVEVSVAEHPTRRVEVTDRGVFIAPFSGAILGEVQLVAHRQDGKTSTRVLPAVPKEWADRITNPETPAQSAARAERDRRAGALHSGTSAHP